MIATHAHLSCDARALALTMPDGVDSRIAVRGGASNLAYFAQGLFAMKGSGIAGSNPVAVEGQSSPKDQIHNFIYSKKAAAPVFGRLSFVAPDRLIGGARRFFISVFAGGARDAQPVGSLR